MAANYVINFTDPAITPLVIGPGTTNTQNSVTLYGMGVQSYGEGMNKNLLHLLENFAYATAPASPITGQLWYDNVNEVIKVYDGTVWRGSNGVFVGITAPSSPVTGQLWYDTDISDDGGQFTVSQLKIYNGSAWVSVASNYVLKTGDTMTGALILSADPLVALGAATKQYVDDTTVSLGGDTMTGALAMGTYKITGLGDATAATDALNLQTGDARYVNVSGDTMTGNLIISGGGMLGIGATSPNYPLTVGTESNPFGVSNAGDIIVTGGSDGIWALFYNATSKIGIGVAGNISLTPTTSVDVTGVVKCNGFNVPIINNSAPRDGDIQVSGSVVSIYAAGSWRQIFPAQYT